MDFYIGGCFQGKLDFVKERYKENIIIDENNFEEINNNLKKDISELNPHNKTIIINHLHLIIKKMLITGRNQDDIMQIINKIIICFGGAYNLVIISDEIGQGVVPVDDFERSYREVVGRVQIEIAKQSESVWRILCQLPMKLK